MFSASSHGRQSQAGFTLIEMLVASAIFAIVAAVAFILYSAAQKSYKMGENLTDQQQATRVAFDRMISDLRLAGFNYNPDGDSTRVDEQIEGAWDTAVTVRGDFDFEDPTASTSPETTLAGTSYEVVSTGNDEIVTYVLSKPGVSGPDTLTLRLDPDKPRARALKTVTIPDVALIQDDPPYTLYRVTLTDVAGAFPSSPQASSAFVYEPVAENIRRLNFRYFDDAGAELGPNTPADDTDDIGGADASSVTRSLIRKITVDLVGMTEDEDLDYIDVTDATATSHYRKFELKSDVHAENLGKTGVKDLDVTPPPTPTNVALVPGHCQGVLVTWDTPPSSSGVSSNVVKYWPNGSPSSSTTLSFGYPHVEYGVIDYDAHAFVPGLTVGSTYCFQVQAKDSVGNQSGWGPASSPPCTTVAEASTPGTPQNLQATGNGTIASEDSQITLTWDGVQANANTVTGDPDTIGGNTIMRDMKGYKLYRDVSSGFTPDDSANLLVDSSAIGVGSVQYVDTAVANCRTYYYKLKTVDTCDVEGAESGEAAGQAQTTVPPEKPTGLTGSRTSKSNAHLDWTAVTTKIDGTNTFIDLYNVYRAEALTGTPASSVPSTAYVLRGTASTNAYDDTLSQQDHQDLSGKPPYSFYYVVSAADLCGNESQRSDPTIVECKFQGTLLTRPGDGDSAGGIVPIMLDVSGTQKYVRARVRIPDPNNAATYVYDQETFSYPFLFPAWDTTASGAGNYTIEWEVENQQGCIKSVTTNFTALSNLACQITPTNPNLSPTKGKPSEQNKKLTWEIINNSGVDLDIFQVDVSWTSVLSSTRQLKKIEYPAGTATFSTLISGPTSPVIADFSVFPLLLPATADGVCGTSSCILSMAVEWDVQIVDTNNVGELVTIQYHFTDASSSTGSCQFTVKPDLTIVN
ncbi:MAG: prepilin-type N-terminal cleavage/methylation domain-containing protein [Acidobacteriota bacterium]